MYTNVSHTANCSDCDGVWHHPCAVPFHPLQAQSPLSLWDAPPTPPFGACWVIVCTHQNKIMIHAGSTTWPPIPRVGKCLHSGARRVFSYHSFGRNLPI